MLYSLVRAAKMHSKKGATFLGLTIPPIFGTLLVTAIVMVALLWFVNGLDDQTIFQKRFLATDLSLVIDTIYTMPQLGSLFVIYHPQRSLEFGRAFSYDFDKNKVTVSEKQGDQRAGTAFFTPKPGQSVEKSILNYEETFIVPIITKQDDIISISDVNKKKFSYSRSELTCTGPGIKKKYFPTGTGEVSSKIAKVISGADVAATDSSAPKLVITQTEAPVVKVYFNGNSNPSSIVESKRAGCEIVNRVRELLYNNDIVVKESGVVPVNPAQTSLGSDDSLKAGDLFLVIGQQSQFNNIEFQRKLANAVKEGLVHARS